MKLVQILGTGCAKCEKLKKNTEQAIQELGVDAQVEKVTDIIKITGFGVMMTPALAVDGQVKVVGKVPSAEEIKQLLNTPNRLSPSQGRRAGVKGREASPGGGGTDDSGGHSMSLKEALTNSLLMFVAATCVVLIVKAISPTPATQAVMASSGTAGANASAAPTPAMQDGFMVYYLHGNIRCPTCRTIESTAEEAVTTGFADELKSGQVQWQVINYETPGNEHYTTDYEVVAPTVVLAKYEGGQQTAWKALPEVWELVGDPSAFITFVQNSLREFMGQSPSPTPPVSNLLRSSSEPEDPSSLPIPE